VRDVDEERTMVTIRIGTSQVELNELREDWLAEQISRRRAGGQNICLEVRIAAERLSMRLDTFGCPVGGPTREPTQSEQSIFDLWTRCGLEQPDFGLASASRFF
jgi:hypothetical protein